MTQPSLEPADDASRPAPQPTPACLHGGGQVGAIMRAFDWSQSPLGPVSSWPESLCTTVGTCLGSRFPILVWWGPELVKLYNDAYAQILGAKHPGALGRPGREVWPEIWDVIGPMLESVMTRGEATWSENIMLRLHRHGFAEECYFTFSYSPIREESGRIGGVFTAVTETTGQVLSERRLRTLRDLGERISTSGDRQALCAAAAGVLATNAADVPFSLLYIASGADGDRAPCAATGLALPTTRLEAGTLQALPEVVDVGVLAETLGGLPLAAAPPPTRAVVLPIGVSGARQGTLIVGVSPALVYDDRYRDFLGLCAKQIAAGLETLTALEQSHQRAEALAELDRAKTAFFSNVSHEFRTPLTLMLGPIDDALATGAPLDGEALASLQRNTHRLLKLVNTLLDFARIEAGRVQARYAPTDLGTATADLASAFRSAVERAGLAFSVSCPRASTPAFVDHGLWEKIVLNLLSNALKFTFAGAISVSLDEEPERFVLRVRDTGIGIPEAELPRLFERFHRVESARGRTQEGSGIGLALVHELVSLHGGRIDVDSAVGRGTTFAVSIPKGASHLPPERVVAEHAHVASTGASAYVNEALRWLPDAADAPLAAAVESLAPPGVDVTAAARILVADDNADMRDYLQRLLSTRWSVTTVRDGAEALRLARQQRFDVILSDVMMPNLDGFALLAELRADARTRELPFVMLSARAGEEARVEGLEAGVDDYLVKPFAARELLARVESQLTRVHIRKLEERHARRLRDILQHAPVGICVLRGPEHVFEFANPDYLELVAGHDVVGRPIREALPEIEGQGIFELLDRVYATGERIHGRNTRVMLNRGPQDAPEECFFEFVYDALRDDDGRVAGVIVVALDVTELARARETAEEATRAKDEFMAMLGHELRNPLAPIVTALQLIKLRGHAESSREHEVIERQVDHLVRLVDDLLDISKITRGKVALVRQVVELSSIVARAVEIASPLLEHRSHNFTLDVPRRGLALDVDPTRMAQVIANLLTNAAKYTDPGGHIELRARRDGGEIVVSVKDDGHGLGAELLPRVFDLFVQGRRRLDRGAGGLGIGLALVRNLVGLHGGTVTASSAGEGRGSEFVVRLPASASTPAPTTRRAATPERTDAARSRRILVVDDNVDAAELLAQVLAEAGHEVAVANDGAEALVLVERFVPDLAVLDIGLPVMDGYELAVKLRERLHARPPRLIAVTGYGQEHDRARSRDAGFEAHFVKPLHPERLLATIAADAPSVAERPSV